MVCRCARANIILASGLGDKECDNILTLKRLNRTIVSISQKDLHHCSQMTAPKTRPDLSHMVTVWFGLCKETTWLGLEKHCNVWLYLFTPSHISYGGEIHMWKIGLLLYVCNSPLTFGIKLNMKSGLLNDSPVLV